MEWTNVLVYKGTFDISLSILLLVKIQYVYMKVFNLNSKDLNTKKRTGWDVIVSINQSDWNGSTNSFVELNYI